MMTNPSHVELLARVDALIRLVDSYQARDGQLLISQDEQVEFLAAEHEVCQAAETLGLLDALLLNANRSPCRRGFGRTKVSVACMGYPGVGLFLPSWRQHLVTFRELVARLAQDKPKSVTSADIGSEERALALLVKHPDWS